MSTQVENHYVKMYSSNIQLLLQAKGGQIAQAVMSGSHTGKSASPVNQIGSVEMQPVVGKFQPKTRQEAEHKRRWVDPLPFDLTQMLDSFDERKLLADPKSSYVQNAVKAAQRQHDKLVINAFFGSAKTGEEGASSVSFPGGNQIAVSTGASGAVGLNVAKLRAARKKFMANHIDLDSEELYIAITAAQHDDLLKEAQIISQDYNSRPVLVDGKIDNFLGFKFIHSELLPVDGSSYRRLPVWCKSGMHLGKWMGEFKTSVTQRMDLTGDPWQAYLYMMAGATRLEEEKVLEIKCAE